VRATDKDGRVSKQLPQRFQEAIDNAAMALGKIGTDSYTDGFQWGEETEYPGTAQEAAEVIAAEIEKKHPSVDWRSLVKREDNQ